MASDYNLKPKPQRPGEKVVITPQELPLTPPPERRYRVEELTTTGWELADDKCVNLTKDEAHKTLKNFLDDGLSPNRLRAVIDN